METNNLFQFATKELSQDAFICWCLNWIHYPDSKLYPMAIDLFKLLGQNDVDCNQKITIKKQVKKIDILVLFHDRRRVLVIEDKTYTSEHNDQLKRYKKIIEEELSIDFTVDENNIQTVYFKTGYFFDDDKLIVADVVVDGEKFLDIISKNAYKGISEILDDYVAYLSAKLKENEQHENFAGKYSDEGLYITWSRISQYKLMRTLFPEDKWEKHTDVFKVYSGTNNGGQPWTETCICEKQTYAGSKGDYYIFWRIDTDNNGPYLSLRFYEKFNKKDMESVSRHVFTYQALLNLAKSIVEYEELCFAWNDIEEGFTGNYYESSLLRIGLNPYLDNWKENSQGLIDSVRILTDCFLEKYKDLEIRQANKSARIEMMQRVFSEIENHIDHRLHLFQPQCNYSSLSKEFYESKKQVWPGLSYLLATCGDYNIALRFEVEDNLYYGVVFFKNEWDQVPRESSNIIDAFQNNSWKTMIENRGDKSKSWCLWWKYLPTKDKLINFRYGSGCYPDLYDPIGYNKIMQEIFMEIDAQLESIKNTGVCR